MVYFSNKDLHSVTIGRTSLMTSINIWCVYVYQSLSDVEMDVNIIWYDIHVIISIQYRFSHRNPNWFYCELILLFYTNNVVFQSLSIGGLDLSLPWDSTKTLAFMNAQTSFYDTSGFSSYPHFLSVSVFQILNINQYCSFLHGVLEKRLNFFMIRLFYEYTEWAV